LWRFAMSRALIHLAAGRRRSAPGRLRRVARADGSLDEALRRDSRVSERSIQRIRVTPHAQHIRRFAEVETNVYRKA
jgi:hypothetical protein